VAQLSGAATDAVSTLRSLLAARSEQVRRGAAQSILELGAKMPEAEEPTHRIEELEKRMNNGADYG
jgi:hypothetical protein